MPYTYTAAIWPPLFAAIGLAALGLYCLRRSDVSATQPLAANILMSTTLMLGVALQAAAVAPATKIAWYKFQEAWLLPGVTAGMCFILEYAFPGRWLTRRNLSLLAVPPLLFVLLMVADDSRLIWRSIEVDVDGAIARYPTTINKIITAYGLGLVLVDATALIWLFIRSPQHRWPAAFILIGLLASRGLFLHSFMRLPLPPLFNPIVGGVFVTYSMYALALFGFRILDPLSAARTAALEQMRDGMVVLDSRWRVAALNQAAAGILETSSSRARGRPLAHILPAYANRATTLVDGPAAPVEISFRTGGDVRHYTLSNTTLLDFRGQVIGYLLLLHDLTEERLAEAKLVEQQRTLAIVRERERLARELHDDIGQVLAFVGTQGQTVRRFLARGEIATADELVVRLVEVAHEADTDIRESILGLRGPLSTAGLLPALATYLEQYEKRNRIDVTLSVPRSLSDGAFEPSVEIQLLRIIQEALTNARKHARARSVSVAFELQDGSACVTVQDDGCGFHVEERGNAEGRIGLRVMRERAEEIGGTVVVSSSPGSGTQVIVRVPLRMEPGAGGGDNNARLAG